MKKFLSNSRLFATLIVLFTTSLLHANADQQIADSLHGHGSLNVVFAVIAIILGGLFIFLWRIDRKVTRMENDINTKKS